MAYLTFKSAKGSVFIPRLVQFLSYAADALLLLLMAWNIGNLFYPIWSTATFVSLWIGLVTHPFFFWLIERFRLRSAIVPKFKPTGPESESCHRHLKYLGFLYSVWEESSAISLAYYSPDDGFYCPKRRLSYLQHGTNYRTWLSWLIVLSTDTIPVLVLVGLACAGYFLGISIIIFFTMGLVLAFQLHTLYFRFRVACYYWNDEMLLDEKMCISKSLGLMMCVMEGPEGELFLTLNKTVDYDHYVRHSWLGPAGGIICECCLSMTSDQHV